MQTLKTGVIITRIDNKAMTEEFEKQRTGCACDFSSVIRKYTEDGETSCPLCGRELPQLPARPGIFPGSFAWALRELEHWKNEKFLDPLIAHSRANKSFNKDNPGMEIGFELGLGAAKKIDILIKMYAVVTDAPEEYTDPFCVSSLPIAPWPSNGRLFGQPYVIDFTSLSEDVCLVKFEHKTIESTGSFVRASNGQMMRSM